MEELKNMTAQELSARVVGYVERIEKLMNNVSLMLQSRNRIEPYQIDLIREEYKHLKDEIRADAHYVYLERNKKRGKNLYNAFFTPSIREASAFGFTAATSSRINQVFYSSLAAARYRLTKLYSLNEWKAILEDAIV